MCVSPQDMERSVFTEGVVLVETVELARLHRLKTLLSVVLAHGGDSLVSSLALMSQVLTKLLFVSQSGVASAFDSQPAEAGETTSLCEILVSLHDNLVEEVVGLTALILDGHDPLHRGLVAEGVSWQTEKTVPLRGVGLLIEVFGGFKDVTLGVLSTDVVLTDSA